MKCKTIMLIGILLFTVFLVCSIASARASSWNNVESWGITGSTSASPVMFNLTILSATGGYTNPVAGNYLVTSGPFAVSITAYPNVNYAFANWLVNGSVYFPMFIFNPVSFIMTGNTTVQPVFNYLSNWHTVEAWNLMVSSGVAGSWHDVETWNMSVYGVPSAYLYNYTFYGTYDEQSGLLTGTTTTVTVYPSFGTPYNITLGPPDYNVTVSLLYKPSYFRTLLASDQSRYYVPLVANESIYVFEPSSPTYTYYASIVDTVGVSNAFLESYVYLNATSFVVERRAFTVNNKIPFVLTQFKSYGFRLRCDQGTTDFGSFIAGDYAISPAFTFTVSTMNFAVAPVTYQNITLTATRMNDTWIQVLYNDAGSQTISVSINIADYVGTWQTVYTDTQTTTNTYTANYYDCEAYKDYVVTVTVNHSAYGTLAWQIPCIDPLYQVNLWAGLTVLGQFPFDITQFFGFFIVLGVFGMFSAKDHTVGLILAIIVAAILSLPPIHWLSIGWSTISIMFCLTILYALGRRKPS